LQATAFGGLNRDILSLFFINLYNNINVKEKNCRAWTRRMQIFNRSGPWPLCIVWVQWHSP